MKFHLVAFLLATVTDAHNWQAGPARSTFASSVFPCLKKTGTNPHAQVGRDQAFELEWASGHFDISYYVLLHESDQAKMQGHSKALFEDYIRSAPAGSNKAGPGGYHRKWHRSFFGSTANPAAADYWMKEGCSRDIPGAYCYDGYKRVLPLTDPEYHGKQPYVPNVVGVLGNVIVNGVEQNRMYQWEYQDKDIASDAYVSYKSAKYPWILAVGKYSHMAAKSRDVDFAMMKIPLDNNKGPGSYIVHWTWNGYYDCIDVQYTNQPTPTVAPYGRAITANNGLEVQKIDHCIFPDPQKVWGPVWEVVTDATACSQKCITAPITVGSKCDGVNVFPLNIPQAASLVGKYLKGDQLKMQINAALTVGGKNILLAGETQTVLDGIRNALNEKAKSNPDLLVCIPVTARLPAADNTFGKYETVYDPEHPTFYSTCYNYLAGVTFPPLSAAAAQTKTSDWKYDNNCVSCHRSAMNRVIKSPTWKIEDKCYNCDLQDMINIDNVKAKLVVAKTGSSLQTGACYKSLKGIGYSAANEVWTYEECAALAAKEPTCSTTVQASVADNQAQFCGCWLNTPSCATPTYVVNNGRNIFTLVPPALA